MGEKKEKDVLIKVKLTQQRVSPRGSWKEGEEVEVPLERGVRFMNAGEALPVCETARAEFARLQRTESKVMP